MRRETYLVFAMVAAIWAASTMDTTLVCRGVAWIKSHCGVSLFHACENDLQQGPRVKPCSAFPGPREFPTVPDAQQTAPRRAIRGPVRCVGPHASSGIAVASHDVKSVGTMQGCSLERLCSFTGSSCPGDASESARSCLRACLENLVASTGHTPSGDAVWLDPAFVLSKFRHPMASCRRTQGFARITPSGAPHLGVDFSGKPGAPVFAMGDGEVLFAGRLRNFEELGQVVIIGHGGGVYSMSAHVKPKEYLAQSFRTNSRGAETLYVNAGDVVAEIGAPKRPELASGPHLHLEVLLISHRQGGLRYTLLNPLNYLPFPVKLSLPLALEIPAGASWAKAAQLKARPTLRAPAGRGLRAMLGALRHPVEATYVSRGISEAGLIEPIKPDEPQKDAQSQAEGYM